MCPHWSVVVVSTNHLLGLHVGRLRIENSQHSESSGHMTDQFTYSAFTLLTHQAVTKLIKIATIQAGFTYSVSAITSYEVCRVLVVLGTPRLSS